MTPTELLQLKIEGNTTIRDLFYGAIEDGAFGAEVCLDTDAKEQEFYETLAQRVIDSIQSS